jgi:hypothetical protein
VAQTRTDMLAPEPMLPGESQPLLQLSQYLAALEIEPDDPDVLAGIRQVIADRDLERLGAEP